MAGLDQATSAPASAGAGEAASVGVIGAPTRAYWVAWPSRAMVIG